MIGRRLGRYRIIEQIGAGGMGVVYRARDERLERDVAVKVLPSGTLANDDERRHFRKEALILSQLNHPNIATVHDFDTQEGVDFLVMEYVNGQSLDATLASGKLGEPEVVRLGIQLAHGLAAAHACGIVHRDLGSPAPCPTCPRNSCAVRGSTPAATSSRPGWCFSSWPPGDAPSHNSRACHSSPPL